MSISIDKGSLKQRGLTVLRGMSALVAINPDQTYVATSIPGLGTCKSTYCQPQRRELPAAVKGTRRSLAPILAASVAALALLSGCATYRPVVDMRDVTDHGQYERDLADCQNYAEPVSPGASAGAGAVFGALLGAALGAAVGDHSVALDAARWGAVEGAVVGGTSGAATQVQIIRNCMSGRGYLVLN